MLGALSRIELRHSGASASARLARVARAAGLEDGATGALVLWNKPNAVISPAKFEGACALQGLGLEENPAAELLVQDYVFKKRRLDRMRRKEL